MRDCWGDLVCTAETLKNEMPSSLSSSRISCARLDAFFNSRLVRGQERPGGTKTLSTSTLCQAGRPAGEELASLQPASGKVHVETWAGGKRGPSLMISQAKKIQSRCVVSVFSPRLPFFAPVLPGPGREIRRMMGWTDVEKTARSGVWWFRSALQRFELFPVLSAAADWVRKGSYHTAWSVPSSSSSSCS